MDFIAPHLAVTGKKWKQNMEFLLNCNSEMKEKEEKYSVFLFL